MIQRQDFSFQGANEYPIWFKDVTAYTWRLYLEFIRVMSEDRASMDFVLST